MGYIVHIMVKEKKWFWTGDDFPVICLFGSGVSNNNNNNNNNVFI